MSTIASLLVRIGADAKELQSELNDVKKRTEKFSKDVMQVGKSFTKYVTAPIVAGLGLAVREAALAEGAMDKFNAVFGDSADVMSDWVDEFRKNVPLARREIVQHAGAMQDLLVPMGINRDEAMGMSQDWLELAGALAAFNDVPVDQALNAIRSGLVGQSEPLRQFGVDARVGALEQVALEEGIIKAGEAMDDQARLQALLIQATRQSADAINGYEDQQGSLLMMQQEVTASVKDIAGMFGNILLPAAKDVTSVIIDLLSRFQDMDSDTVELIIKIALLAAAIGPVLIGVALLAKGFGIVVGVVSSIFGAIGGLASSLLALSAPFWLVIAAIGALIAIGILLWKNWDKVKEVGLAVFDTIKDSVLIMIESIKPAWESLQNAFQAMVPILQLLGVIVGIVFATALAIVTGVINGIIRAIGPLIQAFGGLVAFVTGVVSAIIQLFRGDLQGAWDALKNAGRGIIDFFSGMVKAVWGLLSGLVSGIVGFFVGLYNTLVGNSIIPDMVKGILKWIARLPGEALKLVKSLVKNIVSTVASLPKEMLKSGKALITNFASGIRSAASGAANAARNVVSSVRNLLPFSDAKEGPLSDLSKMDFGGPISQAIAASTREVRSKMESLVGRAMESIAPNMSLAVAGASPGGGVQRVEVRHVVDLINTPSTVDQDSLEDRLEDMLNNPEGRRALDRAIKLAEDDRHRGKGIR